MVNTNQSYTISGARFELTHIVERVRQGEKITIKRHKEPVAVIVSLADAEKLAKDHKTGRPPAG